MLPSFPYNPECVTLSRTHDVATAAGAQDRFGCSLTSVPRAAQLANARGAGGESHGLWENMEACLHGVKGIIAGGMGHAGINTGTQLAFCTFAAFDACQIQDSISMLYAVCCARHECFCMELSHTHTFNSWLYRCATSRRRCSVRCCTLSTLTRCPKSTMLLHSTWPWHSICL